MALSAAQRKFLAAYAVAGSILHASRAAKGGKRQHYVWLETSEEYRDAFASAQEDAILALEDEARRRAMEGLLRPKFHNGHMVMLPNSQDKDEDGNLIPGTSKPYMERAYSDTLLIFLLKGLMPQRYRDNVNLSGTLDGGASLAHEIRQCILKNKSASNRLCDDLNAAAEQNADENPANDGDAGGAGQDGE